MVPPQIRFVPICIMLAKVGLLNTYAALILPYATSALGTFLIREAFASISNDVLDAARIDGANVFQIIFRVMVPIAMPTIIAFSLFSVVYHWNDYFWPLVMTTNETVRTLPLGVALLREESLACCRRGCRRGRVPRRRRAGHETAAAGRPADAGL